MKLFKCVSLEKKPTVLLLHDTRMTIERNRHSLLKHLLNNARVQIPVLLKTDEKRTKGLWVARVSNMQFVEQLTLDLYGREHYIFRDELLNPIQRFRIPDGIHLNVPTLLVAIPDMSLVSRIQLISRNGTCLLTNLCSFSA